MLYYLVSLVSVCVYIFKFFICQTQIGISMSTPWTSVLKIPNYSLYICKEKYIDATKVNYLKQFLNKI